MHANEHNQTESLGDSEHNLGICQRASTLHLAFVAWRVGMSGWGVFSQQHFLAQWKAVQICQQWAQCVLESFRLHNSQFLLFGPMEQIQGVHKCSNIGEFTVALEELASLDDCWYPYKLTWTLAFTSLDKGRHKDLSNSCIPTAPFLATIQAFMHSYQDWWFQALHI